MEPKIALIAGKDGLKYVKKIIEKSNLYLKKNGYLLIEIGYEHSKKIKNIDIQKYNLKLIGFEKDLNRIERVAIFQKI